MINLLLLCGIAINSNLLLYSIAINVVVARCVSSEICRFTDNSAWMSTPNRNISSSIPLSIHFAMYVADHAALAPNSSNDHHQSAQQLEQFLCFLLLLLLSLVTTLLPLLTIIVVLVIVLCRVANCRRKRKRTDNYKIQCRHCCCSLSVYVCVCVC